MRLVYRHQLFPREAYRPTFERLLEAGSEKIACRQMVEFLAMAHERACEAELAKALTAGLAEAQLPERDALRRRFAPQADRVARNRRRSDASQRPRRPADGRRGMSSPSIDAKRLGLILNDLRLPAIKLVWPDFAARADKEGWPAARLLAALAEHEIAERDRLRIERHLAEARLPPGKTLDSFAFDAVPMVSRAQVAALSSRDGWLEKGTNLILSGPTEPKS
jgi:IstB-like ATP binding protein